MPRSGCSAMHGMNPNEKKLKNLKYLAEKSQQQACSIINVIEKLNTVDKIVS